MNSAESPSVRAVITRRRNNVDVNEDVNRLDFFSLDLENNEEGGEGKRTARRRERPPTGGGIEKLTGLESLINS